MYEIGGIPREENATFVHLKPKSVIRKICFLFVIFLLFLQQKSSAKQYN